MSINVKDVSMKLVELVGGVDNISSVTHCTTRMRFNLKNKALAKTELIKKLDGVLGVADQSGQYQVILGENMFPIFDEISKTYSLLEDEVVDEFHAEDLEVKKSLKDYVLAASQFLSSSLAPFITVLFGAGMLKVIINLLSYFWPSVSASTTYQLFNFMSNVPFYFMPIFIAYGTARALKANPAFTIAIAGMLVYPNFVSMVSAGDPVAMFGIPVKLITYSSTLLPALLSSILCAYMEKLFYKIIPGILRTVFAPLCILLVTLPITLCFLGPVGNIVGGWVVTIFVWIQNTFHGLGVGLFAAGFPFLVMMGVNMLTVTPMTELFTRQGYDNFFRPGYIIHNCAEGGSCLGVYLKTKDKDLKSKALSASIAGIVSGVSEPSVYGIMIPFKKPLIGTCVGALVGGTIAGAMGASAFSMGYSSILAIPIFGKTAVAITVGIVVTIVVSCAVSFVLFKDEKK